MSYVAWVTLSAAEVVTEGFNTTERTAITAAAGADDVAAIVAAAIAEWRGAIAAAGHELDATTTTIPPSCRRYIVAQVRWQLLLKLSKLTQLQTEERKAAADQAEEALNAIVSGDRSVEDPTDDDDDVDGGGAWGSKTQVAGRLDGSDATA
jgi:hypothetical protein